MHLEKVESFLFNKKNKKYHGLRRDYEALPGYYNKTEQFNKGKDDA